MPDSQSRTPKFESPLLLFLKHVLFRFLHYAPVHSAVYFFKAAVNEKIVPRIYHVVSTLRLTTCHLCRPVTTVETTWCPPRSSSSRRRRHYTSTRRSVSTRPCDTTPYNSPSYKSVVGASESMAINSSPGRAVRTNH